MNIPKKGEIKNIIFDFGGTLVKLNPSRESLCANVLKKLGYRYNEIEISNAYEIVDHIFKQKSLIEFTKIKRKEFYNKYNYKLAELLLIDSQKENFNRLMLQTFQKYRKWEIFDDALSILTKLKESSKNLYILANWDDSIKNICKENRIFQFFNGIYTSFELGAVKPNSKIFISFIKMTKIKPEHSVYIGDEYLADVIGSRTNNFFPLLIKRKKKYIFHADCIIIDSLNDILKFI